MPPRARAQRCGPLPLQVMNGLIEDKHPHPAVPPFVHTGMRTHFGTAASGPLHAPRVTRGLVAARHCTSPAAREALETPQWEVL